MPAGSREVNEILLRERAVKIDVSDAELIVTLHVGGEQYKRRGGFMRVLHGRVTFKSTL